MRNEGREGKKISMRRKVWQNEVSKRGVITLSASMRAYTSGKASSAAGLTAAVVKDRNLRSSD